MTNTNFLSNQANYSCATAYVATQLTITAAAPTLIATQNANRNHLFAQNQTGTDVYIGFSSTMTPGQGILCGLKGKTQSAWARNDTYLGDVYAMTSAGTSTIVVHESDDVLGY